MKQCVNIIQVNQANNFLFAGSNSDIFNHWKQGLQGCAQLLHIKNPASLKTELARVKPEIAFLHHDLPDLHGPSGIGELKKLSPATKIVMFGDSIPDEEEWAFFRAGVRGYCRDDIDPDTLKTLVKVVQRGELWIRRTLTYRLLEQITESPSKKNKNDRASLGLLASLTQREYEIAMRVSKGGSNKQIAQSLKITERTVKAHLTEVYRKLGVVDRLKLARILFGDERQVRREANHRDINHKDVNHYNGSRFAATGLAAGESHY